MTQQNENMVPRGIIKHIDFSKEELVEIDLYSLFFIVDVLRELQHARIKFPGNNVILTALMEEAGELAKACLDEPAERVWKEAVQTAAMALRVAVDGDNSYDFLRGRRKLGDMRWAEVKPRKYHELPKAFKSIF